MEKLSKKKKIKWKRALLFGVILLLVIGSILGFTIFRTVSKSVNNMYKPLDIDSKQLLPSVSQDPISILLLGVDERPGDIGRSDTMIVITVNPETETSTMMSIPRDTRAFISSKNTYDKINAAYAYGGVGETAQTIERFLNIPIDYYVKVNMDGFKDIVDAVGGVTVNNPFAFTLEGIHIPEGKQHINGEVALKYVRMRKEDPRGDFGRQQRQREVIDQIINEGSRLNSLVNYKKVLKALEKNVQTNLTFDQMIDIQRSHKNGVKNIKQMEITGEGGKIDNLWYYIVSEETRMKLSNELRKQLNLPIEGPADRTQQT
ncbi:LCP family glycopolymer transferase [Lysinibacillus parviboronicapiens]|uniref:LCP family glycopolymer transferase n=1 Tax=Lysinibacillus parviboronicapiens TaxID=436516 RepID=UPI000D387DCA|nr:LCP family protein [Lysinibacillus parviboronicapiens]